MTLKDTINAASPLILPSALQSIKFGDVLRSLPTKLVAIAPAASPYVDATVAVAAVPDDAKAAAVFAVYAKVGGGTAGPLALHTAYPPITNTYAISPTGDLAFLAADAWTSLDALYLPDQYDIVEMTVSVTPASGACALPASVPPMFFILEAEALAGGSTGKKIIDAPGTASAAGHARFTSTAKAGVSFAVADAVTSGRVKLAVKKAVDVNALLQASSLL